MVKSPDRGVMKKKEKFKSTDSKVIRMLALESLRPS